MYESGAKLVKTLTTTGTSTEVTSLNSGVEYEIRIYSVGDGDVQSTESTNFNAATCEYRIYYSVLYGILRALQFKFVMLTNLSTPTLP